MKTYRLESTKSLGIDSSFFSDSVQKKSWSVMLILIGMLACAALTVFSSARVMLSSHELAKLHTAQVATQQEIRFLESEYAAASSLEKVQEFAERVGLVNATRIAGIISETVPLAQRQ
jgi:cell division protein FtsL